MMMENWPLPEVSACMSLMLENNAYGLVFDTKVNLQLIYVLLKLGSTPSDKTQRSKWSIILIQQSHYTAS